MVKVLSAPPDLVLLVLGITPMGWYHLSPTLMAVVVSAFLGSATSTAATIGISVRVL